MSKLSIFMIAAVLVIVGFAGSFPFSVQKRDALNETLLAKGRGLYVSLCERCHGADGSETSYPNIVPLDGIDRRLDEEDVASLSAPFVGRTFEGEEARALFLYLSSLKGTKNFEEPGWLFSPYLLNKKYQHREEYRVVDVRSREEYEASHIPGAVHVAEAAESEECLISADVLAEKLTSSGISEEIFTVVYDENGGPEAACLWWNLVRRGYKRVAILDGGFRAWMNEGYPQTNSIQAVDPAHSIPSLTEPEQVPQSEDDLPLLILDASSQEGGIHFDWKPVVAEDGLKHASELRGYFKQIGVEVPGTYRVQGSEKNLGFFVFASYLLGYEATYNPSERVLSVREPTL